MSQNNGLARVLLIVSWLAGTNWVLAQESNSAATQPAVQASAPQVALPAGITEEMLAPPPVPGFMLKPPTKPLSMDEMVQQAREAELKAGIKPPQNSAK